MNCLYLIPLLICLAVGAPVTYDQRQDGELNVRADLQNFMIVAMVPKFDAAGSILLDILSKSVQGRKGLKNRRRPLPEPDMVDEQDGPDARIAEPFLESKMPYQVDISQAKSNLAKLYPQSKSDIYIEAIPLQAKLTKTPEIIVESPVPDVLPVKDNQYVVTAERNGKIIDVIEIGNESVPEKLVVYEAKTEGLPPAPKDSGLLLLGAQEQCGYDGYRDASGKCQLIQ